MDHSEPRARSATHVLSPYRRSSTTKAAELGIVVRIVSAMFSLLLIAPEMVTLPSAATVARDMSPFVTDGLRGGWTGEMLARKLLMRTSYSAAVNAAETVEE